MSSLSQRRRLPWVVLPWVAGLALASSVLAYSTPARAAQLSSITEDIEGDDESTFLEKLEALLGRLEKSTAVIRAQILDNPSAPFLPNLYLQLGELQTQRAEALYYLEMERGKGKIGAEAAAKSGRVRRATEEAIVTLKRIDADFPQFDKRPKALLLLAAAQKSLDDFAGFKATVDKLARDYPEAQEAAKGRLLLGEHYFTIKAFEECAEALKPVIDSPFNFEKNAARYRVALSYLTLEKWAEALRLFEEVIRDPLLEATEKATADEAQPIRSGTTTGGRGSNLKREALIDSVRAYPKVHADDEDAVAYYSALAPTEVYFQEVMEKLAYRYLTLKKPEVAIRLLRAIARRVREPGRVIRIYTDVLMKTPPAARASLTPDEMSYLLQTYREWVLLYQLPTARQAQALAFVERQIRELGTTPHDQAKTMPEGAERERLLARASDFYRAYLAHLPAGANKVKIGLNLGDAEYLRKRYPECGDAYLRVFQGEHGPQKDLGADQEKVIQNAVLCYQQAPALVRGGFYESMRLRGRLIKSIRAYIAWKPALAGDARLGFSLLKALFEQGYYEESLPKLMEFVRKHRATAYAVNAGDLILDFHNVRNDTPALNRAAGELLALKLPDAAFNAKLAGVRKGIALKRLGERVDTLTDSGGAKSSSEGYLKAALSSGDDAMKSVALQEALSASRKEGDIDVFLRTAGLLAQAEKSPAKRAELYRGMAGEAVKVGRYYQALSLYAKVRDEAGAPESERIQALAQAANLALPLHDAAALATLMESPLWDKAPADTRARATEFLIALLEAGFTLPPRASSRLARDAEGGSDELKLALLKSEWTPGGVSPGLKRALDARCGGAPAEGAAPRPGSPICLWDRALGIDDRQRQFVANLEATREGIEAAEKLGAGLQALVAEYSALEAAGDPHLDSIRVIRLRELFAAFGGFLARQAAANPDFKAVLEEKVKESQGNADQALARCRSIAARPDTRNPASPFCGASSRPPLLGLIRWSSTKSLPSPSSDPANPAILAARRKLFQDAKDEDALLDLAVAHLDSGHRGHSLATALIGISTFPPRAGDFSAVAACASQGLGLPREASFHLKSATDYRGLKSRCAAGGRS